MLDPRLELSLFASDPDVVTPIGIAVDGEDRVFVLESHTHTRPPDYAGPGSDRVLILLDTSGNGVADSVSVFAEGIEQGMNLAFSPEGVLYVVAARGVWALFDRDGDGVSEAREQVIEMREPASVWPHAALLAVAFSTDGWMYVSRGNTGGQPYTLVGTDGSEVSGYGDGGNLVRSRPDGSELHEFATGFWNAFTLMFDRRGRLLLADNDPDSRGPNRVVQIVEGGDYGYRSLYGGSGIHPYLAWNGELPGTLPYAVAIGEAPAGMIDATWSSLPRNFEDQALVTIWEESRIDAIRFAPKGVSLGGAPTPIVVGGAEFRPVAMATDSRGNIYVTDWVRREYLNHGRGRVWRLSTRDGVDRLRPRPVYAPPEPDPAAEPLRRIYASRTESDMPRLMAALRSDDPFLRAAAVTVLSRPAFLPLVIEATRDPDPRVRLGALLALRRAELDGGEPIARRLLSDPDPDVRRMALIWTGDAGMLALRGELRNAITAGPVTPELFETYLATVEQLTPEFVAAYRRRAEPYARLLKRELPAGFVEEFVGDAANPPELRSIALRHLGDSGESRTLLVDLARGSHDRGLRLEAVRSLAYLGSGSVGEALLEIARDHDEPAELRAEAIAALSRQPVDATGAALDLLLTDGEADVRLEAARYLRTRAIDAAARDRVTRIYQGIDASADRALREQLEMVLGVQQSRPSSLDEWVAAIGDDGGSPDRGARVFHSAQSTCSQCHTADGRGGTLGPDLSNVGLSKSRRQLVQAILDPSAEISPEYQGWYVRTPDGRTHYGRQIDVGRRSVELYVLSGEFVEFEEFIDYGTMDRSLMPDGLHTSLTVSEMRDLVRYMERAR